MGMKSIGCLPEVRTRWFRSFSISNTISRPLTAHSVSTVQFRFFASRCPCTKGVAKASAAQAAENAAPLSIRTWCGVSSAVTG